MWINGRDPVSDSWIPIGLTSWRAGVTVGRSSIALPNVRGVIPGSQQTASARTIRVMYRRRLDSLSERNDALARLADLHRGLLWVRFEDATDRVVRAEASVPVVTAAYEATVFSVATIEAAVDLVCYDGTAYDSDPRVIALATTPVEIPLGDVTSPWRLTWGGAWTATTTRTLTWRDAGGVARAVMTLTAPTGKSIGATDHLELDSAYQYATKVSSAGTRTASEDWLASDFLVLDPAHQDRVNARYGTLEISAGTAQLTYRRAWGL